MDLHERKRLLYVALTRARDHLIVSSHHTKSARSKSHGGRLTDRLDELEREVAGGLAVRWTCAPDAGTTDGDVPARRGPAPFPPPAADAVEEWQRDVAAWREQRASMIERSTGGGVVSATAISRAMAVADEIPGAPVEESDDEKAVPEREPWRRGRAGTSIGSAVHAVLQHADLTDASGADLGGLATWQAGVEGVADSVARIEAKARSALASPLVRRAVASGSWRRELHVAAPLAALIDAGPGHVDLFEGFVDLLFDDGDGLVVVDYKTDDVPSAATVDAALERYAPQGAAYAVALEAATGRPVTEVHFLFLRGTEAVDVSVPGLGGAKDRVRAALASYGVPT